MPTKGERVYTIFIAFRLNEISEWGAPHDTFHVFIIKDILKYFCFYAKK